MPNHANIREAQIALWSLHSKLRPRRETTLTGPGNHLESRLTLTIIATATIMRATIVPPTTSVDSLGVTAVGAGLGKVDVIIWVLSN